MTLVSRHQHAFQGERGFNKDNIVFVWELDPVLRQGKRRGNANALKCIHDMLNAFWGNVEFGASQHLFIFRKDSI